MSTSNRTFQADNITPKYRHACGEWDYLIIDENCPKFACCTCYSGELFKILRDMKQDWLDKRNERDDTDFEWMRT